MREEIITEWSDFDDVMAPNGPYRSWAFRGHCDARWEIWTSISRHLQNFGVQQAEWPNQEGRLLRIFKRKAHLYLQHVPDDGDDFQWLALIQHHGGPTRLLDFTWSPYVAALFALELATTDAAVFAFHTGLLSEVTLPDGSELPSLRVHGRFEEDFLSSKDRIVVHGEPGVMNRRLTAQLGTFVVPGVLDEPVETIIDAMCGPDALVKFVLSKNLRDSAMRSLYDRNVHNASLFPDLNGLAASLRYELETHWAFDPKMGTTFPEFASSKYARSLQTSILE